MPTFSPVIELLPELQVARLDVAELFGRNAPLHVDLGCGDGSFLCEMAQQFPKRNFLGIERLTKRVEKVRRKAEKIENVRVLRADTLFAVRYLLPKIQWKLFIFCFPTHGRSGGISSDGFSRATFWMQSPMRWRNTVSCASRPISSIIFIKSNG